MKQFVKLPTKVNIQITRNSQANGCNYNYYKTRRVSTYRQFIHTYTAARPYSYMSIQLHVYTSTCLYNCMSIQLHVYTSTCLYNCMSIQLHVYTFTCLYNCMSIQLHVYTAAYQYSCMSIQLHVYTAAYQYSWMSIQLHVHTATCLYSCKPIQLHVYTAACLYSCMSIQLHVYAATYSINLLTNVFIRVSFDTYTCWIIYNEKEQNHVFIKIYRDVLSWNRKHASDQTCAYSTQHACHQTQQEHETDKYSCLLSRHINYSCSDINSNAKFWT